MHFAQSFLFFEANELPAAQACQAPRVARGPKIHPAEVEMMTCQGIVCFIDKEHSKFTFLFSCSDFFFFEQKIHHFFFTEDVGALRETFQVDGSGLGMEHVFFWFSNCPFARQRPQP